jgi:hypothetical protein
MEYLGHLKARTIVTESDYVDRDYLEDDASYYVGNYQPYPKLTKRLHFFKGRFTPTELLKAFTSNEPAIVTKLQASYLGFIVARPLPGPIIGRTVLQTYEPNSPEGKRCYPTIREYTPSLFGIPLTIRSLAYQQQDRTVAACATVALWSAFHRTETLFDSSRPTPATITRVANSVRGNQRAMPSSNLNTEQMAEAIRSVGLEPELVEIQPETPLSSLIYAYVSFGVPVVLLVRIPDRGGHAMTVTGFKLADATPRATEHLTEFAYAGRRISEFFVHDDNIGPFAHLRIAKIPGKLKKSADEITRDAFAKAPYALEIEFPDENQKRIKWLCAPQYAIVPIYPKIRLNFIALHGWLTKYALVLDQYASKLGIDPKELRWDVRLDSANAFKRNLRQTRLDVGHVLLRPYPRYIWRVSIEMAHRQIVELTVDTTEMAQGFPFLDALHYDAAFGEALRHYFSIEPVRDLWRPFVGAPFIDFLARSTSAEAVAPNA